MDSLSKLVADALDPGARLVTGAEIRAVRIRAGITQQAMSQLIGVSRPTLANWETGAHESARKHRPRIAELVDEITRQLDARKDKS